MFCLTKLRPIKRSRLHNEECFLLFCNRTLWVQESLNKAEMLMASSGCLYSYFDTHVLLKMHVLSCRHYASSHTLKKCLSQKSTLKKIKSCLQIWLVFTCRCVRVETVKCCLSFWQILVKIWINTDCIKKKCRW